MLFGAGRGPGPVAGLSFGRAPGGTERVFRLFGQVCRILLPPPCVASCHRGPCSDSFASPFLREGGNARSSSKALAVPYPWRVCARWAGVVGRAWIVTSVMAGCVWLLNPWVDGLFGEGRFNSPRPLLDVSISLSDPLGFTSAACRMVVVGFLCLRVVEARGPTLTRQQTLWSSFHGDQC